MPPKHSNGIYIKGARTHNLKNITLHIPHNKLVVITGLSGSGKSSLAFDTLFAEGQRRYVESLSAYIRQFLDRMNKPDVESIEGIPPAIAIEQKSVGRNSRSTVGTSTEIYEYLKLLFARIGHTFSPISGTEVTRHSVSDVVDAVCLLADGTRIYILIPLHISHKSETAQTLTTLQQEGFSRLWSNGQVLSMTEALQAYERGEINHKALHLLLDRLVIRQAEPDFQYRLTASIETAFHEGDGECDIFYDETMLHFSNKFQADGLVFAKPSPNFFSFNNPYGACPQCEGTGFVKGLDENLIIPNKFLSVYEGAVACWKGYKLNEWKEQVISHAATVGFPIHKPYKDLTANQKKMLWEGTTAFSGINTFFEFVSSQTYKIQYRVLHARYSGQTICPSCKGQKLRSDAAYVKVGGKSIQELSSMSITQLSLFFQQLALPPHEQVIAERLLTEITNRLEFLLDVGLGYLTLDRPSPTLSGGEAQRILLATSLGSSLVGSMYILDEPSVGLHPRDTGRLIRVLKKLRDMGNSVIVVEHDEEIIRMADHIIDIGLLAGNQGGYVVFEGSLQALKRFKKPSYTAQYIRHELEIPLPTKRRKWKDFIEIERAWGNNLKEISVKFPLHVLTVVCGVSGSGKTTLVKETLYPSLLGKLENNGLQNAKHVDIHGDYRQLSGVELIDQNPIGRSSRSNPATYLKIFDDIRLLFAEQPLAKKRGYKAGFFSFNIAGGRCETCLGAGEITVSMQFMADAHLKCDTCGGKRFTNDAIEVLYKKKSISDILDMTIDEAFVFFGQEKSNVTQRIQNKLQALQNVGLGYLKMGQSSSSMSGGEVQRIKLAYYLSKGIGAESMLFIFDEPSTGLHFHDIFTLNAAMQALINNGHSIIVIEHHPDIIKVADWVIELGPEGGEKGGKILFEGTPEAMIKSKKSITAAFLKEKIK